MSKLVSFQDNREVADHNDRIGKFMIIYENYDESQKRELIQGVLKDKLIEKEESIIKDAVINELNNDLLEIERENERLKKLKDRSLTEEEKQEINKQRQLVSITYRASDTISENSLLRKKIESRLNNLKLERQKRL